MRLRRAVKDKSFNLDQVTTLLGLRHGQLRELLASEAGDTRSTSALNKMSFPEAWVRESMPRFGRVPEADLQLQYQKLKALPVTKRPVEPVPWIPDGDVQRLPPSPK
jgi:hypothetical protein